jgi:hypothetical protein
MKRMNNWYLEACRLGLRTLWGIMDVMFDFRDIHNMFRFGELDIEMVRL